MCRRLQRKGALMEPTHEQGTSAPAGAALRSSRPCGIWLWFGALVANKGSTWVRFVILFWVRHWEPSGPRPDRRFGFQRSRVGEPVAAQHRGPAEGPPFLTQCEDSMAATEMRLTDRRWEFVFSARGSTETCHRRFAGGPAVRQVETALCAGVTICQQRHGRGPCSS